MPNVPGSCGTPLLAAHGHLCRVCAAHSPARAAAAAASATARGCCSEKRVPPTRGLHHNIRPDYHHSVFRRRVPPHAAIDGI